MTRGQRERVLDHDHARRDGKPVDDPDLCFVCARAELRSMRADLAGAPSPEKDDQRHTASTAAASTGPMVVRPTQLLTA